MRRYRPRATGLRVKDGEQALRFLFHRGLFTEKPETPDLIVLSAELPIVIMNIVLARLRQHPRTQDVAVIVVPNDAGNYPEDATESQQWLHRDAGVIVIIGTQRLENEVANAMHRLSAHTSLAAERKLTETL